MANNNFIRRGNHLPRRGPVFVIAKNKMDICQMQLRHTFKVSAIWIIPALLVVIESLIFLPKALRNNSFIPYFIIFWVLRASLSPLVVWYTLRFPLEKNRIVNIFFVHLLGFLLFSICFWSLSYLLLHDTLFGNSLFGLNRTNSDLGVFSLLADNSLSTNIVVYVSTVMISYAWQYYRKNAEASKKADELEKSLLKSRLEILKSQLNTHFLFNTLHTISSLVVRNKNEEANKMLLKLSDLLRFAVKENKDQLIPLSKEIEILQLYLDIQKERFNDRLTVGLTCANDVKNALVPAMLLQPVVENAIKYGIEPFAEKGNIDINIGKHQQKLLINISDSGQSPFEQKNFNNGIGLSNTRERLQQLFGKSFKFEVSPNPSSGTCVSFELPLQLTTNGAA